MENICAWCEREIDSNVVARIDDGNTAYSICHDCIRDLHELKGIPLMEFLNTIEAPIMLLATDVVVLTCNDHALNTIGRRVTEIQGHFGGEVFECANASLPGGCGRTIHCSGCTIRGTVMDTFMTGTSYIRTPAYLNHMTIGNIEYLISTEKVDDMVLLKIDKI